MTNNRLRHYHNPSLNRKYGIILYFSCRIACRNVEAACSQHHTTHRRRDCKEQERNAAKVTGYTQRCPSCNSSHGRLHRENESKKDVRIYDYIDIHEPVCENMYRKRLKGYFAIGYRILSKDTQTLFDNTDDLQISSYEGQIFNGNTFRLAFMQNLKSSKQSIVISSPKLYRTERNTFVKMLRELHVSGVQVAILTSEESSQTNYLKSLGLYVKIVPKLSLSSCIIDRSTVWYGSINILGYVTDNRGR